MRPLILFGFVFFVLSCQFDKTVSDKPIARVGDQYLYLSDLQKNLRMPLSLADSATVAQNFINSWAREQLLLDKAVFNLNNAKQNELEGLVQRYRSDLYINTYQEEWLKVRMDTLVTLQQLDSYYAKNKQNFKLHQDLMRGRYIKISQANFNRASIRSALRRFNRDDMAFLDSISLQLNGALLNDSIWLRPQAFFGRMDRGTPNTYGRYLKSNRFFEIEDSLDLYLVFVAEVRRRNEVAPMSHVHATLKQILLNKRKLEMMRQLDRDVLQAAVKENVFELYE
jgi:hypothetical protein